MSAVPVQIWPLEGWEQHALTVLARVQHNGSNIQQADISSIACTVRRYARGSNSVLNTLTPTVTVSSAVFDSLQTDGKWTEDATGYNFAFTVPGTAFPDGARYDYIIGFIFTPASGNDFPLVCKPQIKSLMGVV